MWILRDLIPNQANKCPDERSSSKKMASPAKADTGTAGLGPDSVVYEQTLVSTIIY